LPQDPGQAGKSQVANLIKLLSGFTARATPESGDKVTRFSPFSAQAEAGNVLILRGAWNEDWFTALEGFPEATHDDDADSTSRAFNALIENKTGPASSAVFTGFL
jgi:predicted phage terminase large subunit-like protein